MFKKGDKVICVNDEGWSFLEKGIVYEVYTTEPRDGLVTLLGCEDRFDEDRFEAVFEHVKPVGPSNQIISRSTVKPMLLSTDAVERKATPITTGVLDYFPRALAAVAVCSKAGNDQHHPGTPLAWDKTKSTDHADCIARHLIDRHSYDTDGILHAVKLAWRALALLEIELEKGTKVRCSGKDCGGNEWNG